LYDESAVLSACLLTCREDAPKIPEENPVGFGTSSGHLSMDRAGISWAGII